MSPEPKIDNPSILNHASILAAEPDAAMAFYDAVVGTIGAKRLLDFPMAAAYGKMFPEFWVSREAANGEKGGTANGVHFAFNAASKEEVKAFYDVALSHGGVDDGAPGPRELYGPEYYGCFVRDLDGYKIEATFWDASKTPKG